MPNIVSQIVEVTVFKTRAGQPLFLILKRADNDRLYPGIWQIVTGKIERGVVKVGEEVEILYEEMDGKKAARFISKELLPDDEMQEDYTEDEVSSNAISEDL